MTPIDWKRVQAKLQVTPDGSPGRNTYAALFSHMGPKAEIETLVSIANAAAVHFADYGATASVERLADLLAQTANESGGFTVFEENLRYSAARMLAIWPNHFTPAQAAAAVGKPVEIASRAYGGRMGNAPYPSDDGYRFRGMGLLQLTGRGNYEATDRRLGIGLDTNPELAAVPALSLLIALDFYRQNKVWDVIDAGDTKRARRITNGGSIGLENVNALRERALRVLG